MSNKHIGSSFNDFLSEKDMLAQAQGEAIKRVLAWQIQQHLEENQLSKSAFAEKLGSTRAALNRLLDDKNTSLTLQSMVNAVQAMGKKIEISITG